MSGYLTKIKTKIPYSDKEVSIDVNGKTLILTGGNGCGKTQLLKLIYEKLKVSVIDRQNYNLADVERSLKSNQDHLSRIGPAHQHYKHYTQQVEMYSRQLEDTKYPSLETSNLEEFIVNYQELKALLIEFEAMRKSEIVKPSSVSSISSLRDQDKQAVQQVNRKVSTSSLFEQFLVTNKANQAFSESEKINNDPAEAARIDRWFTKLETDLRNLFEDRDLELVFKSDSFSFEIHQPHKEPYTFQTLSSGFSSIMAVYADLITKVSLRSIDPEELTGVVLIDEIDAHLHVSLQKKILSFLTQAFPRVQFIVSTHSPFVVSSIDDAVIYDLSKREQVEDLSMYSYESVLEGLFGVLPISSLLQQNIEALAKLLDKPTIDVEEVQSLLDKLPPDEDSLDSESLYFVNSAKLAINKAKR
ncbi:MULTISPECIES: AAA family ATPase [Vibrio]|uniref:AAA family ATPase n=1 Tax=Vibrio TaxID=662 RepID=UPI001A8FB3BF|nr:MULTISPECIES: AAA family ATPase [Vibrio]MBO0135933.1 AAA family ATPase [Vibrio sp. Vb2736]MBS9822385.1 AAA family ATPase [Vibrio alginolyticus]MBS9900198.1 AAA family ATPase [Vibrio alginolyticus]MDW2079510.1 AAA family ATPase [Vibrio sp. 1640]